MNRKKLLTFLLLITFSGFLTACNQSIGKSESIQSPSKLENITWKSYDKKYVTLSGIRYPEDFYLEDKSGIEIRSAKNPLINNDCFFTSPCPENGLVIFIGLTKPLNPSYLADTDYPNIKKVDVEKEGANSKSIKNYNYKEYLFTAKDKELPYLIQIYEKNFEGNSEVVIEGILSSLHEDISITLDTSEWKEETSVKGLTFSYPPEFQYQGGGDTDGWSAGTLENSDHKAYFRLVDYALLKCKFSDPALCNIGTNVSVAPSEFFELKKKEYKENDEYSDEGEIKIGNVTGHKFILKSTSMPLVLFHGTLGVYSLEALEKSPENKMLNLLLSTFKVK